MNLKQLMHIWINIEVFFKKQQTKIHAIDQGIKSKLCNEY